MSGPIIASLDPISEPVIEAVFEAASPKRFESNAERIWSHEEGDSKVKTWAVRILFGFTVVPYLLALFVDLGRYMLFKRGYIDGKSWSLIEETEEGCRAVARKVNAVSNEFMLKKHAKDVVGLYRVANPSKDQIETLQKVLARDVTRYAELNGKSLYDFSTYVGIAKKLVQEAIEKAGGDEIIGREPLIHHLWKQLNPHLPKDGDPISELAEAAAQAAVPFADEVAAALALVRQARQLKAAGQLLPEEETRFATEASNSIPEAEEHRVLVEERITILNFLSQKKQKIREHIDAFCAQLGKQSHDELEAKLEGIVEHCRTLKHLMQLYGEYAKLKKIRVITEEIEFNKELKALLQECKNIGIDYSTLSGYDPLSGEEAVQTLLAMAKERKRDEPANSEGFFSKWF